MVSIDILIIRLLGLWIEKKYIDVLSNFNVLQNVLCNSLSY